MWIVGIIGILELITYLVIGWYFSKLTVFHIERMKIPGRPRITRFFYRNGKNIGQGLVILGWPLVLLWWLWKVAAELRDLWNKNIDNE